MTMTDHTTALTDEQRKIIKLAAACLEHRVEMTQDSFDEPPYPATAWDQEADQLAYALRALLATPRSASVPAADPWLMLGWRDGVEAVAKMLDKKADDYAGEFGSVDPDTGALEFGTGSHAEVKRDYHSSLVELADEVRAMAPERAAVSPATADERAAFIDAYLQTLPRESIESAPRAARGIAESVASNNGAAFKLWLSGAAFGRTSQAAAPAEAYVRSAGIRDAGDELHIECRMSDGQKGAFVRVDIEFPELAHRIAEFISDLS